MNVVQNVAEIQIVCKDTREASTEGWLEDQKLQFLGIMESQSRKE